MIKLPNYSKSQLRNRRIAFKNSKMNQIRSYRKDWNSMTPESLILRMGSKRVITMDQFLIQKMKEQLKKKGKKIRKNRRKKVMLKKKTKKRKKMI